jgi:hypothetical protein
VDTTNPINGNDLGAVAENLIMEAPNPQEAIEDAVEVTDDGQPETVEAEAEVVDDTEIQASEESVDEEYEEAEESEVQEEPIYRVRVDGEEKEVSLDELKRGYSGQKYIQKGMAEAAQAKKQVEEVTQKVTQERQMLAQMMQQIQNGEIPPMPQYPSEELRASDPLGYLEAEAEYRRAVDKRNDFDRKAQYVAQQQRAQEEQQHNQFLEQQAMRLQEWMPDFADPEKRTVFIKEMTTKAKKHYDLTSEQISTVKTAEEVMILNDALKWRELQQTKTAATKKAEGARPVVKPAAKRAATAGKVTKSKQARAQMQKRGGIDDVANFLLS